MTVAEMVTEWMNQLVEEFGGAKSAETQEIEWNPKEWEPLVNGDSIPEEGLAAIEELSLLTKGKGITRQHVRAVGAKCGDVGLFTAAMIWGLKPNSYGPYRLGQMLTTRRHGRDPVEVINEIVQTARTRGAAEGFGSLWTNGASRIFRLGTAFGTKVLYFAAAGKHGEPPQKFAEAPPLILDQFVHLGAQRFVEVDREFAESVPDPSKYMTRTLYERYCKVMADRARTAEVTPDCLEMVLFSLGKNPERFSVQ
jgi:hypothetical protein